VGLFIVVGMSMVVELLIVVGLFMVVGLFHGSWTIHTVVVGLFIVAVLNTVLGPLITNIFSYYK
jgi:ABC-type polysaccharide/polyol phosphate export permease